MADRWARTCPPKLLTAVGLGAVTIAPGTRGFWHESMAWYQWLGLLGMVVVLGLLLWTALVMRRHRTSMNPMRPADASSLLTQGPFAWSRNPMYLADVLLLALWSLCVAQPLGLCAVAALWLWLNFMQIPTEERALSQRFGGSYSRYAMQVRRWVGRDHLERAPLH